MDVKEFSSLIIFLILLSMYTASVKSIFGTIFVLLCLILTLIVAKFKLKEE